MASRLYWERACDTSGIKCLRCPSRSSRFRRTRRHVRARPRSSRLLFARRRGEPGARRAVDSRREAAAEGGRDAGAARRRGRGVSAAARERGWLPRGEGQSAARPESPRQRLTIRWLVAINEDPPDESSRIRVLMRLLNRGLVAVRMSMRFVNRDWVADRGSTAAGHRTAARAGRPVQRPVDRSKSTA